MARGSTDTGAPRGAKQPMAEQSGARQHDRVRAIAGTADVHADWDGLNATIDEVAAPEIWVTHGREDALIHAVGQRGIRGRALRLLGYGEEEEGEAAEAAPP